MPHAPKPISETSIPVAPKARYRITARVSLQPDTLHVEHFSRPSIDVIGQINYDAAHPTKIQLSAHRRFAHLVEIDANRGPRFRGQAECSVEPIRSFEVVISVV